MSSNLELEEKDLVLELIGPSTCFSMGIAELAVSQSTLTTDDIQTFEWKSIIKPGIVCLLQDPTRDWDYFIRVFDIGKGVKVWELRIELNTRATRRRRHLILLDSLFGVFTACLNFVDNDEADIFSIFMSDIVGFDDCKKTPQEYLKESKEIIDLRLSLFPTPSHISSKPGIENDCKRGKLIRDKDVTKSIDSIETKNIIVRKTSRRSEMKSRVCNNISEKKLNEIVLEKLKLFLGDAGLDMSIFDDPEYGSLANEFFEKEKDAFEAMDAKWILEKGDIHNKKCISNNGVTSQHDSEKYDVFDNPYYEDALPLQSDFERTRRHMSLFMANKKDALLAEEVRFSEERSLKLSAKGFCDANENKKASSTLEPSSDKSQQDNKPISESSTENASDDSIESTTESDFDDVNESEISNCKSSSQNCGKSEAEKFSTFREKLQHKRNDSCSIVIRRSPLPPKKSCPPPSPTSQKVISTSRYKWKAAKATTIKRSKCNSVLE